MDTFTDKEGAEYEVYRVCVTDMVTGANSNYPDELC